MAQKVDALGHQVLVQQQRLYEVIVHTQRYIDTGATEADVVRVDGKCYRRIGLVEHEPDADQEDVSDEFPDCVQCGCCDAGQYLYMTYQMVAQNSAGWDFARAHAGFPAEPLPAQEQPGELCSLILGANYHLITRQRTFGRMSGWASIRAHASDVSLPQQFPVYQVTDVAVDGNSKGYDFAKAHPLL